MPWPEETLWDQVVRLIVQAAVEERSGEMVALSKTHRDTCEPLDPCQPSCVF